MKSLRSIFVTMFLMASLAGAVLAQVSEERADDKYQTPPTKAGIKTLRAKDVGPAGNDLIAATTYGFTSPGGGVLENMAAGTTQLVGASADDTASAVTNIGFDFWFDGVRYTQFSANANGLMSFGPVAVNNGASGRTNDFATTTNNPKVTAYWDDLCTGATGKVHYKVIGSPGSRKLIVEWLNMTTFGTSCATGLAIGTYQVWINESNTPGGSGVVQLVYGAIGANSVTNGGYSIGMGSSSTSFASVTSSTNTVSYAASSNAQTNAIAAGTTYVLTPNIPNAPSNNLVTGITPTGLTLNWLDNSANEVGFVVYRSTDNVNFTFLTQTAANATSFSDTGLTPSTNYFYTVYAVTEGALSTLTSFGATTAAPGAISCAGPGGLWSSAASWVGGIPTGGDSVTIGAGCTITIDTAAVAFGTTVQSGGVLQFESATARTLTVGGGVTINAGGTFQSAATGTVTTHVLSLVGNLTNNGTLDFSTNADTAGAVITFTGNSNSTFGGTGATTDVRGITLTKSVQANTVELNPTNFTVRGVTTDVAGYLTLTAGTFKISGTFTMTNRTFLTATYLIPTAAGIWLNNPNYAVAGTATGTTSGCNGLFRLTQGIYTIGLTAGDGFGASVTTAVYIIEGGTLNANGRFDPQGTVNYTQTAGTVNVAIVGNNVSAFGSFEIFGTTSTFNMSGGIINIINPSTGATKDDFSMTGQVQNVAGGQVVFGATGAPASSTYAIPFGTSFLPNFTVNPTMTLNINNVAVFFRGTAITNNGAIISTGTSARFDFANLVGGMTYSGAGTFGTLAAPFASIGSNSPGFATLNGPIVTLRVNLFTAGFINSNQITLGNAGASTSVVQTGSAGLLTPGGTFDVSPVHNQGTGGEIYVSAFETVTRTLTNEINPTRILTSMSVDNLSNINIGAGDLTVSSPAAALTLTNGEVRTGSGNFLIMSSATATVTRTNGYVAGNLRKTYAAVGSKTFEVGENGFTPAVINITAGTFPMTASARSVDQTLPGLAPAQSASRHWTLAQSGGLTTANLSFTYLLADVNGNETDYRVFKRDANVDTNMCPGGPCVNTGTHTVSVTGITTFSAWGAAENITPTAAMASISGRVLTADGRGIVNAMVTIEGGNLPAPIMVHTGSLGWYSFENMRAGETYIVTASAKRFRFANGTHVITLVDSLNDSDFTANP